MGFAKLREWVGTMTGKGDRWGRDSVGRSAPTFMAVPLHSPTYLQGERPDNLICGSCCFCCEAGQLVAVCLRPVPGGESAGCVCLQCLFCGLLFACSFLPAMPTALLNSLPPFISSCPRSFAQVCFAPFTLLLLRLPLFISMCARIG